MLLVLRRLTLAAFVAASLGAVACGGSSKPAVSAADIKLAPAPADLGIAIHVHGGGQLDEKIKGSLTSQMSAAGYKIIDGKDADVDAKVTVTQTEVPSMFKTTVNGKTKVNMKVTLAASFVAKDGSVVDSAQSDYETDDGSVDEVAVKQLLGQLSNSGKLVAYSNDRKSKVAAAEDDLWKAANVDGCKASKTPKDCDGVKAYIAKYPSGKYTADGRKALQDGETSLAKAQEDDVWAKASVDTCTKPTKSYDCQGVDDYLKKYPTGAHAAEGKAAEAASQKQRDAMAKKEAAEKKKSDLAECTKDCKYTYRFAAPGAFEILVNRCVDAECK